MRLIFLLITCLWLEPTNAQTGFNLSYDLGQLAAAFSSVEVAGDTIIIYGVSRQGSPPTTVLLFCRLDTFGNIIDQHIFKDTLGDNFTIPYQNSLIKLSNGSGYAAVGQFFNRENGYFVSFDNKGAIKQFREYPDTIYSLNNFRQIIETDKGFFIVGNEADASLNTTNIFLMKVDSVGNLLWEKKYKDNTKYNLLGQLIILDGNQLIIGGTKVSKLGIPLPESKFNSWIFGVDSLGILQWNWESEPSLDEMGVGKLSKSSDGNWVYTTAKGRYNQEFNEISVQPKLIIRDVNFNIIKEDTFGIIDSPVFGFSNLVKLKNNDWITVGVKPVQYEVPPIWESYNSLSGWIARFDNQGNEIWNVIDTAFWSSKTGSTNYLFDVVELSSGSLIACGYSRTSEPSLKDWGWVIKLDKNGCIDTLFCETVSSKEIDFYQQYEIKVFPNPAYSYVYFVFDNRIIDKMNISIFDANGKLIEQQSNLTSTDTYTWHCGNKPKGMYFYRIQSDQNMNVIGKIIHN